MSNEKKKIIPRGKWTVVEVTFTIEFDRSEFMDIIVVILTIYVAEEKKKRNERRPFHFGVALNLFFREILKFTFY